MNRMRSGFWIVFSVFFLFGASLLGFTAIDIESLELGYDQLYKRNRWVPIRILVTSRGENFEGHVKVEVNSISSDTLMKSYSVPLSLQHTDRQKRLIPILLSRGRSNLRLQLINLQNQVRISRQVMTEIPRPLSDLFVLVVSPNRDGLRRLHKQPIDQESNGNIFIGYTVTGDLPTSWRGYDSIDTLVVRNVPLSDQYLLKDQQTAMLDWIQNGGILILSGGRNFHTIKGSFLRSYLPVSLSSLQIENEMPESISQRFDVSSVIPFDKINFVLRPGGEVLIGDAGSIHVAKSMYGSGTIISLSFDYASPPFSDVPFTNQFWSFMIAGQGRSARHAEYRFDPFRKYSEKILKQLETLKPKDLPLIKFIICFLLLYLLVVGGVTFLGGNYNVQFFWLISLVMPCLFSSAVICWNVFVPSAVSVRQLSVLSVFPDRDRAHLQSYIGLIGSTNIKVPVDFGKNAFVQQLTGIASSPIELAWANTTRLNSINVGPWFVSSYLIESFIDLQFVGPPKLENEFNANQMKLLAKHAVGIRGEFLKIINSEGVLRYLETGDTVKKMGWTKQSFLPILSNVGMKVSTETLVLLYDTESRVLTGARD